MQQQQDIVQTRCRFCNKLLRCTVLQYRRPVPCRVLTICKNCIDYNDAEQLRTVRLALQQEYANKRIEWP